MPLEPRAAGRSGPAPCREGALRRAPVLSAHSKTLDQGEGQSGLPAPQISRIGVGEVNERIDRLRAALGRFDGFAAEEIMPDMFRIVDRSSDRLAAR